MAPRTAARRGSNPTFERRLCTSSQTWLLALAHDACRRRLERLGLPLLDDDLGPPVPASVTPVTCGTIGLAISRQLDGRLAPPQSRALRDHLRSCADCAGVAADARAQRAALRQLAEIAVPASINRKVFAVVTSS